MGSGPLKNTRKVKKSDSPPAQGCAGKINRAKRLIWQQVANRVCEAARSDKAMDGIYQSFLNGLLSRSDAAAFQARRGHGNRNPIKTTKILK